MPLNKYQTATVEHLKEVYKKRQDVYLVADEVGLGKTFVAKGLIKKNYTRIIYIASNPEIAKQNAGKLGGTVINDVDRLSMLGSSSQWKIVGSNDAPLVLPISPATSFTGDGSPIGNKNERDYYKNALSTITAKIDKLKNTPADKEFFAKVRTLFCTKAVEQFKPDLIIMDEFHRFNKLLTSNSTGSHYSLDKLIEDSASSLGNNKRVKILLLSATPYVFCTQTFKRIYNDDNTDKNSNTDESVDKYSEEFKDFEALKNFISAINNKQPTLTTNSPKEIYKHILCRTERKWLQGKQQDVPIKELLPLGKNIDYEQIKAHLNYRNQYLQTLRINIKSIPTTTEEKVNSLIKNRLTNETIALPEQELYGIQSYTNVRSFLDETPEYAQFGDGYMTVTRGSGSSGTIPELRKAFSALLKENNEYRIKKMPNSNEADFGEFEKTYGHAKWDMLREIAMPPGSELRLWVPPTTASKDFSKTSEDFSKTIVFAHYRMSTRAIAALTSIEAQKRLLGTIGNADVLNNIKLTDETLNKLCEPILEFFGNHHKTLTDEEKGNLTDAINTFFQTTHARRVLTAWAKNPVNDNLVCDYCEAYCWSEMITEYLECLCAFNPNPSDSDIEKALKTLLSSLSWEDNDRTRVLILPDWSEEGYPCTYGERYSPDYSDKKAHDKDDKSSTRGGLKCSTTKRLEYIRERFQSPFYPFVLAASETAQEGVDLHNYCDTIFHWSVPSRLNTFTQETGRVDRRASLTQRRQAVWLATKARYRYTSITPLTELFENIAQVYDTLGFDKNEIQNLTDLGLFPYWFLPAKAEWLNNNFPQLKRVLFHLPLSCDQKDFDTLLEEQRKYRTFGLRNPEDNLEFDDDVLRRSLCPMFAKNKL